MRRSGTRTINPYNKHTIDIYQSSFEYLELARTTPIGKVSLADIVKELERVYKLHPEDHKIKGDV